MLRLVIVLTIGILPATSSASSNAHPPLQAIQAPGFPVPGMANFSVERNLNSAGRVASLLVYRGSELAQTLDVCTEEPVARAGKSGTLATADFNFDGLPDLALQTTDDKSNNSFCVWLFDPQQQHFIASSELSGLTNPVPDAKTRNVISTRYGPCPYCYERQEFRWISGELTLIQDDSLTMDSLAVGTGGCDFIRTVKKLEHGKMHEISRDRTDAFGHRCVDDFWLDRPGMFGSLER